MPAMLIEQISQRLQVSPDDASEGLKEAVERIRQQVEHFGYARLTGVGTFRSREGTLTFEPDEALADAVNHRFAGLETLTVDAPGKEAEAADEATAPPEEAPAEEEDLWAPPADAEVEHPLGPMPPPAYEDVEFSLVPEDTVEAQEEDDDVIYFDEDDIAEREAPTVRFVEEEEVEETVEAHDTADETDGPTVQWMDEEEPPAIDEAGPKEEEPATDQEEAPAPPAEAVSEEPPVGVPEPEQEAPPPPPRRVHHVQRGPTRRPEPERPWLPWVAGGVVVVLLAIVAVYVFVLRTPSPEQPVAPPVTSADTTTAPAAADTTAMATNADTTATTTTPAPPEDTPLRSVNAIDERAGGWTVVVASEVQRAVAERTAESYATQGYRSGVLVGQTSSGTRYRVGVGQFATRERADAARNDLAGNDLPSDAWVLRIR